MKNLKNISLAVALLAVGSRVVAEPVVGGNLLRKASKTTIVPKIETVVKPTSWFSSVASARGKFFNKENAEKVLTFGKEKARAFGESTKAFVGVFNKKNAQKTFAYGKKSAKKALTYGKKNAKEAFDYGKKNAQKVFSYGKGNAQIVFALCKKHPIKATAIAACGASAFYAMYRVFGAVKNRFGKKNKYTIKNHVMYLLKCEDKVEDKVVKTQLD